MQQQSMYLISLSSSFPTDRYGLLQQYLRSVQQYYCLLIKHYSNLYTQSMYLISLSSSFLTDRYGLLQQYLRRVQQYYCLLIQHYSNLYTAKRELSYQLTREKKDAQAAIIFQPSFFYRYHYCYSFSNCSAVVLVFVSQRNSSSQQLLSLVLVSQPSFSSQQSDPAGRQGPKKERPWGSNRPRGTRESTNSKHHKDFKIHK